MASRLSHLLAANPGTNQHGYLACLGTLQVRAEALKAEAPPGAKLRVFNRLLSGSLKGCRPGSGGGPGDRDDRQVVATRCWGGTVGWGYPGGAVGPPLRAVGNAPAPLACPRLGRRRCARCVEPTVSPGLCLGRCQADRVRVVTICSPLFQIRRFH